MKHTIFKTAALLAGLLVATACSKPVPSQQITGFYTNSKNTRKMQVYADGDLYYGKIIAVTNPDDQVKPGDVVLSALRHEGNKWKGQACFNGACYSCTVKMPDDATLRIISMGQSKEWKRD